MAKDDYEMAFKKSRQKCNIPKKNVTIKGITSKIIANTIEDICVYKLILGLGKIEKKT